MPILLIQIVTIVTNIIIFIAIVIYFVKIRAREKVLEEKERQADSNYHHVVDEAQAHERKIIDDAQKEASHIITDAQYVNQAAKQAVDQALQKMTEEIRAGALSTSQQFMSSYSASLKQLSLQSVTDFQGITKSLESDLQQQIKEFRDSLLPAIQKELEGYKARQMADAQRVVQTIVQKASREVIRTSLGVEDQEKLIIEALEKAKKEGIFD